VFYAWRKIVGRERLVIEAAFALIRSLCAVIEAAFALIRSLCAVIEAAFALFRSLCAVIDTGACPFPYPPVSISIPPGMNIEARGIDFHTPRYEHRSTRYRFPYPSV
jgi:hypothetical protein